MRFRIVFVALTIWLWPLWASAQEVRLDLSIEDADLHQRLQSASLVLALRRDDSDVAQDYVAAGRADYRRLLTGLYQEGYYGGTVSVRIDGIEAARMDPLRVPSRINAIVLHVTPGPRFQFGTARIAPLAPGYTVPDAFATNQVARAETIRDTTRGAIGDWRARGHALANATGQQITANHRTQRLDVDIILTPGPVLSYGPIGVSGAANVRPERIRAIAGISSGETFDPADLNRAETNLRRTGAFASARVVEGDAAGPGNTLPLDIQVAEQLPRRIGYGAEYSSVNGLTLSGYWMHRNLLGGAERFRLEGEITGVAGGTGGTDYRIEAGFLRPATFRSDVDFYADLGLSVLDEPKFYTEQITAEAGFLRRIGDDAEVEIGLGYRQGETRDATGTRSFEILTLPVEGVLDRRDSTFDATAGFYASLEVMPFVGLDATDNGVRLIGDGRYYHSLGPEDRLTLAFRGQFGAILGAQAGSVPADFLFYSGGGGTVRGQPYQSLAVDLGGGQEIGGLSFLAFQTEARLDLNDKLGFVGFYDLGFIGPEATRLDGGDWHAGAGLGLRYQTGIGPIRLDLATPVSGADAGRALEVYIGIGQAF